MAILSSCCCCSVETGTRMIALLNFMNTAYLTVMPVDLKAQFDKLCLHSNFTHPYCNYSEDDVFVHFLFGKSVIVCTLITSILLLFGAHSRNRFLLLPWIIWNGLLTVMFCMFVAPARPQGRIFTTVIFIWSELCVISHFQNLRDEASVRNTDRSAEEGSSDSESGSHRGSRRNGRVGSRARNEAGHGDGSEPPIDDGGPAIMPPPYEETTRTQAGSFVVDIPTKSETPPPAYYECLGSPLPPLYPEVESLERQQQQPETSGAACAIPEEATAQETIANDNANVTEESPETPEASVEDTPKESCVAKEKVQSKDAEEKAQ